MRDLHFLETVGAGSFGTVYLAELCSANNFRRQIAVKVLHAENSPNSEYLARGRDEARLLGLLRADSILQVLGLVKVKGMDAILMEFVEGTDLDTILKSEYPPSPRAVAEIAAAAAGALAAAHNAVHPRTGEPLKVIHRDIKPANIMLTRSGGVKICDFGVSRALFNAKESVTQPEFLLGTLNYMAPEYIITSDITPAFDVFSLGICILEATTGVRFGPPKNSEHLHKQHVSQLLQKLPNSCNPLRRPIEKMLSWRPESRPKAEIIEQMLLQTSDQLTGKSLRSWAAVSVPQILQTRTTAPDVAELIGQTIPIHERESGDSIDTQEPIVQQYQAASTPLHNDVHEVALPPKPISTTQPLPLPSFLKGAALGVGMGTFFYSLLSLILP